MSGDDQGPFAPVSSGQVSNVELEDPSTFDALEKMLQERGVAYKLTQHHPVRTSEEAAAVRGVSLDSGAKAMIVKDKSKNPKDPERLYYLAVMSASKKLSWKLLKKAMGIRDVRLATEEEVWEVSRCRPGAVPPFGTLFGSTTMVDPSLVDQGATINFNCGLRTRSISMAIQDYLNVENPMVVTFCE